MRRGITFGAFDILHAGHCLMLEEAKKHCDYLIVGLQRDPSITLMGYRGKKKNKPIQAIEEREIQLRANRNVDEIVLYDTEEDLYNLLLKIKPDIRIIGTDWKGKKFTGWDLPIEVYYNSRGHSYSSTELRGRIKNS
ncbi:MAG: hypothetical protein A3E02_00915 [Candidatus Zambryskibacteria bacterium RIFCSPHIGHO2_12_FULL_38_34]|uniref:Cytidyltransferase-like domain-containing protein n=1 Tax=Candidatus Zambryskibacteria bacterium RIFCSPLOWO2_12_FULL_39_16 TaxID=1802775 RepID=A0A1G2US25_9BACT|nr:MAG: hypothetical protein A3D37_00355 [Candidatus Zambryskibacteria bacterium RIFCSPHIGHO2_02_FULL_38_22]OHA97950.1 MAG: hypothetical protein A3E02_00915 [Candidatus Zambryskibacteria bacterium RIFCSPHIGHO2_12_FULL_38_34]OHB09124.1 MAG: hypothetical protein A3I19_00055 [Candidatus Zambryskibacteria bacterium RIFCSPLOWO2_02_FULL_38_13]OHB12197.1 MAG: hypothetical protein A3G46_00080 [Candidatus Zambryskibacteria bacterium RIFCSPLOWO2_12_FULL_39_16]